MDDLRIGAWIRAERKRRGLRQSDVAVLAKVGDETVGRIEHGRLDLVTVARVRAVAAVVEVHLQFAARSLRGASLDRQIDWRHAALVDAVVAELRRLGWDAIPEWSFNHFGDRGSVDVLAWHPRSEALLNVEVKSEIRDIQATLHALDVKRRVVPALALAELGWKAACVAVVLVVAELATERRRVAKHRATFDAALPARTVDVRRWLQRPADSIRAIWFLSIPAPVGLKQSLGSRERVRRGPARGRTPSRPPNHPVASVARHEIGGEQTVGESHRQAALS